MYIDYTPEQKALRDELRTYFAKLMTPERRAGMTGMEGGEVYRETILQMGKDGWLGVGWPTEYGGQGLTALEQFLAAELEIHDKLVVLGDFNIAPEDRDVYDAGKWGEDILCSPAERAALAKLMKLGLADVFRQFEQPEKTFSWWDYRAAGFRRNAGLRIDLILATDALADACKASYVDREPRTWERPSDHAPVVAEFSL